MQPDELIAEINRLMDDNKRLLDLIAEYNERIAVLYNQHVS